MSDAVSIATKSTLLTSATGFSRASQRSTRSKRQKETNKTNWRTIVRETYAALFDVIGDWTYLYAIYHRDYGGNGEADEYILYGRQVPTVDYEVMILVVLGFCVMSTIFSFLAMLTSLGRQCGKNSMCCNCTVPRIAMTGILFEDVPQFILTVYIDYTFSGGLTPAGMLNICSSVTALISRATTRYDEILDEEEEENDDVSQLGTAYEAF